MFSLNLAISLLPSDEWMGLGVPGNREIFCDICISISENDRENREIFAWKWDAVSLLSWLLENKTNLMKEAAPSWLPEGDSVACQISRFYQSDNDWDDGQFDEVFDFRKKHGLRFAMRGADIPDIYLAIKDGNHEISFDSKEKKWKFEVDLSKFYSEIELKYFHIFRKYLKI